MIELTSGQEWVLATEDGQPLTRLQMGVGWDKEKNAGFIGSGARFMLPSSIQNAHSAAGTNTSAFAKRGLFSASTNPEI